MSLTETKKIDKIEITDTGNILVRESIAIMRGDEIVAQTFHRYSFEPGSDVSSMPTNVQEIAAATWTDSVIADYKARFTSISEE